MGKNLILGIIRITVLNSTYKKDIKKNPAFRADFQRMCTNIGVDPLACERITTPYRVGLSCLALILYAF